LFPNFYNPGLGHQPYTVLTVFSRELTAGPEHTTPAIIPTDLLADKIICGHRPTFRRLTQLGIRDRRVKSRAGKSGNEVSASRGHLSTPAQALFYGSASRHLRVSFRILTRQPIAVREPDGQQPQRASLEQFQK
jgi:hypothetical protein